MNIAEMIFFDEEDEFDESSRDAFNSNINSNSNSNVNSSSTQQGIIPINQYRPPKLWGHKIVRWKPIYDMMIADHIMGYTDKEIAEKYNVVPLTVSNVRHSDHGQKLIAEAHQRLRSHMMDKALSPIDRAAEIKDTAMNHLLDFVKNEELMRKSPFAFIKEVRQIAAVVAPPNTTDKSIVINNNIQNNQSAANLSAGALNQLTKALNESRMIDERYLQRGEGSEPGGTGES